MIFFLTIIISKTETIAEQGKDYNFFNMVLLVF